MAIRSSKKSSMVEVQSQRVIKKAILGEMEKAPNSKVSTSSDMIEGKLTLLVEELDRQLNDKISRFSEKLDRRLGEISEMIRLITSNGSQSGSAISIDDRSASLTDNMAWERSSASVPFFQTLRVQESNSCLPSTMDNVKHKEVWSSSTSTKRTPTFFHSQIPLNPTTKRGNSNLECYGNSSPSCFDFNRFGGDIMDNAIAELENLQETDGIMDYHNRFDMIRTRVRLSEEELVSIYLAGLRTDTQENVRMFQPHTIKQCFTIGKLYESVHPRMLDSDMNAGEDGGAEKYSSKEFLVKKPVIEDEPEVLKVGKETFLDAGHMFDEMQRAVESYGMKTCAQIVKVKGELVAPEYEIEVLDLIREQDNSMACEVLNELITHEKMATDETRIQCFDPGGDLHNSVAEFDGVGKTHDDGNLDFMRDFTSLNTIKSATTCSELIAKVDEYGVRRIAATCVVEYIANQMPYDRGKVKFINGDVGLNQVGSMKKDQSWVYSHMLSACSFDVVVVDSHAHTKIFDPGGSCLLLLVNLETSVDVSVLCNRENKASDFSFKVKGLVFDPGKNLLLKSCRSKPGLKASMHFLFGYFRFANPLFKANDSDETDFVLPSLILSGQD